MPVIFELIIYHFTGATINVPPLSAYHEYGRIPIGERLPEREA